MTQRKQIRIVKRAAAREAVAPDPGARKAAAPEPGRAAVRGAAAVVTGWVRETRRKKLEEASRGFESLFGA